MALFKKTEKKEEEKEVVKEAKKVSKKVSVSKPKKIKKAKKDKRDVAMPKPKKTTASDVSWVLLSPRITEKSAYQSEHKIYIFNVHKDSNKIQIKEAIMKKFEVTPIRINVAKINSKPVTRKGIKGSKPEGKKAFVYLSKKDSINFV
jgi:large subunit ribosomal protein L23